MTLGKQPCNDFIFTVKELLAMNRKALQDVGISLPIGMVPHDLKPERHRCKNVRSCQFLCTALRKYNSKSCRICCSSFKYCPPPHITAYMTILISTTLCNISVFGTSLEFCVNHRKCRVCYLFIDDVGFGIDYFRSHCIEKRGKRRAEKDPGSVEDTSKEQ